MSKAERVLVSTLEAACVVGCVVSTVFLCASVHEAMVGHPANAGKAIGWAFVGAWGALLAGAVAERRDGR